MKNHVFCVFFLIFLTLVTCTVLSGKIEEEMTLEVIGYPKNTSYDSFSMPKDMYFTDEQGSHLYEVYEGTGWESGLRAREISVEGGYFTVDRDYTIVRGASRQPVYGELVELYDGKDTGPGTYVAYYPNGVPEQNAMLFQAEILEQSEHVLVLYQKAAVQPFTENRTKGGLIQLTAPQWDVYSLDALDQLLRNIPNSMLAIGLVLSVAVLGVCICILSYHAKRNQWLLLLNGILIVFLLNGLSQVLKQIDLPASMLPRDTVFNISHYRRELAAIFDALEELASETTRTYAALRETALRKGYTVLLSAGILSGITAVLELRYSHTGGHKKNRLGSNS